MYPVLFKIGGFEVHTFGLVLIIAFAAAYLFGRARAARFGLTKEQVADAFFWTLVLGVLGARVGFILQELPYYLKHPHELLSLRFQGLTSFGGLIAGFFALLWFAKRAKVPVKSFLDLAAAPLLLGHAIGRVGCLMNGCCYGGHCDLPWGIHVAGMDGLFHPAQIYDSLMVLAGLGLLLFLEKRGSLKPGQGTALAVILYSASRFIYEFWRAGTTAQVDSGYATSTYFDGLPITDGQLFALIMIAISIFAWFRLGRAPAPAPAPEAP